MRTSRIATLCVALLAATLVSGAVAKDAKTPAPPKNLRGFLLQPNEPLAHTFPRTPAFAWAPVRGARCYEFELATSRGFSSNSVIWSNVQDDAKSRLCSPKSADPGETTGSKSDPVTSPVTSAPVATTDTVIPPVRVPAVSVDLVLPWFTGQPYSLYARVRAITTAGPTRWSTPFGFNMRWSSLPAPRKAAPGLVRWSQVEGATGYQVWYPQLGKSFSTNTTVADLRDFYTFHRADSSWWRSVKWRVRPVRRISGTIANGLPTVSFGQWSPVYTGVNPALTTGKLRLVSATSDRISTGKGASAHELMPALVYAGDQALDGQSYEYFRAYVATDRDCVNVVYRGAVVGSPSYAPRTSGPLALPSDDSAIVEAKGKAFPQATPDGKAEGTTFSADWRPLVTNETQASDAGSTAGSSSGSTGSTGSTTGAPSDESQTVIQARVDLPDVDFPSTRYYWTVVPVAFRTNPSDTTKVGYVDVESPQDACQAGRVMSFGKESDPVETGAAGGAPYVAGLSPSGRLLTASSRRPLVYSTPLVTWRPVTAATAYQVQWSRTKYPWRAVGGKTTFATSSLLDLGPGTWYYRVRGLNQTQIRRAEMAWSLPVRVKVAQPTFTISR